MAFERTAVTAQGVLKSGEVRGHREMTWPWGGWRGRRSRRERG